MVVVCAHSNAALTNKHTTNETASKCMAPSVHCSSNWHANTCVVLVSCRAVWCCVVLCCVVLCVVHNRLKDEGLLCMRPWHDEVIVVMAPPKAPTRCFYNSIIRETLSTNDKDRVSWTGNLLCLSSSLQSEVCPDLGGVTRYTLNALLQVRRCQRRGDGGAAGTVGRGVEGTCGSE